MKRVDAVPFMGGIVCGMLLTFSIMSLTEKSKAQTAPPSSEWKQAQPFPLNVSMFGEPHSPTNTPIVVDKSFNIYVYGKWVADTNGLR